MPRPRSPLGVALLLALVPAVAFAVWLGPLRGTTPPRKVSLVARTPTAAPSPVRSPTPVPHPVLAVADRLDVSGTRGFGAVPFQSLNWFDDFPVAGYTLTARPRGFPTSLPVWQVRGFAPGDTAGLAEALGIAGTPGPDQELDPARGHARSTRPDLRLAAPPTSDADAILDSVSLLGSIGVPALASTATVEKLNGLDDQRWVRFTRRPLDGLPVGMDGFDQAQLLLDLSGNVQEIQLDEAAVDGGSTYALRDWHEAWTDVVHHRWAALCCPPVEGNPGGPDTLPGRSGYRFTADRVYLYYEDARTTPDHWVPFYAFRDTHNDMTIGVPALRGGDIRIQP